MKSVHIKNRDMDAHIAANILLPPNVDRSKIYSTIVREHSFGSCKAQTFSSVYGKALAEQRFVVAHNASFQSESGGAACRIEDPTQQIEDVSRVIDYAVTLPYVDESHIDVFGVWVAKAVLSTRR